MTSKNLGPGDFGDERLARRGVCCARDWQEGGAAARGTGKKGDLLRAGSAVRGTGGARAHLPAAPGGRPTQWDCRIPALSGQSARDG